jgi:hypothetical protein
MRNSSLPEGTRDIDIERLCMGEIRNIDPPFDHYADDDEPDYGDSEEDCSECGGEGWITRDCDEDSCCCADPETEHGQIPCLRCNPGGKR